jgi:hypothetical protein
MKKCEVIPFPLARRRRFIDRHARYAGSLPSEAAERHLKRQLLVQAGAMRRKGVREDVIIRELSHLELAIRSMLSPPAWDGCR